ncbi:recombinase RecA, partial [Burkholderia pseudomallei]
MSASSLSLESLHPSLWRGSQLARGGPRTVDTGYAALSVELPGGGRPPGGLGALLLPPIGSPQLRLPAPPPPAPATARRPPPLVPPPP